MLRRDRAIGGSGRADRAKVRNRDGFECPFMLKLARGRARRPRPSPQLARRRERQVSGGDRTSAVGALPPWGPPAPLDSRGRQEPFLQMVKRLDAARAGEPRSAWRSPVVAVRPSGAKRTLRKPGGGLRRSLALPWVVAQPYRVASVALRIVSLRVTAGMRATGEVHLCAIVRSPANRRRAGF